MRKLVGALIVCAAAVSLVVVSGAGAVKSTKQVYGTVTVGVSPNPVPVGVTTVTASGNVASNSSCRKDRTVTFEYFDNGTPTGTPAGGAPVVTGPNGGYTTTLPAPTTSGQTLRATLWDGGFRKVGSKKKGKKEKKGRKFYCNGAPGFPIFADSVPITLQTPTP